MSLRIRYFGMIAEALQCESETIISDGQKTVGEMKTHLENRYPVLKNYTYRIAVNQTLSEPDFVIPADAEIALLPPFAGG